jgi:pimeloyl-ACP methyl ester carboxylesterase
VLLLVVCWWRQSVVNRQGWRNYHVLIRYILDRRSHQARWEAALDYLIRQGGAEAVYFYWGLQDPVSGGHVAEEIERRFLGAKYGMTARRELGHWPMLEDPAGAEAAMLRFFGVGEEGQQQQG